MKSKHLLIAGMAFLMLIGTFSTPASAAVVWSDDFSDGNYDGWTVYQGSFDTPSAPRYYLAGGGSVSNWIHHPSTQVVGTWLFEMYEDGIAENDMEIVFMVTGTIFDDLEGYSIGLQYGLTTYGITLFRWNYSSYVGKSARFIIIRYDIYGPEMDLPTPGWRFYNITRTIDGNIYVSRNDELVITCTPTIEESAQGFTNTINASDKFMVKAEGNASIDTIVVGTDLPPITTETTTTTTTSTTTSSTTTTTGTTSTTGDLDQYLPIIAIGGGAVVLIVVIVVIMKKR